MRRLLLLSLVGLMLAMLVFAAREEGAGASLLSADDLGSLIYKVALVVLVGAGVLALFRDRFTQALEATLLWVVIGLLLALGYTYRFELRDVGERVLAEIMPGRAATRGRAVEIARSGSGEFQVSAQINGARLPMVLDTGASAVALTSQAAKAAGLPIELVKYTVSIDTANGQTHAAAVTLDRITVGGIVERSVPALIAQPGQLRKSLLGMSFLNRLQGWEVRGDKLLLRGYP